MDKFHWSRTKAVIVELLITVLAGLAVCFGYNIWYFEMTLPNGAVAQILDVMDYVSNNVLMPIVSIGTCILIGWILKPKTIVDVATKNGEKFGREKLFNVMIKYVTPVLLLVLLLKALGIITFI